MTLFLRLNSAMRATGKVKIILLFIVIISLLTASVACSDKRSARTNVGPATARAGGAFSAASACAPAVAGAALDARARHA